MSFESEMEALGKVRNTGKYIPFEKIIPNIMVFQGIPGVAGTGFFCKNDYCDDIFYVTALHCFIGGEVIGPADIKSNLYIKIGSGHDGLVVFRMFLVGDVDNCSEDVIIFVVDKEAHSLDELEVLRERSFELCGASAIDSLIDCMCSHNEKVRAVGYPSVDGEINGVDVVDDEFVVKIKPRAFWGAISRESVLHDGFSIHDASWKDGEYSGFSGAPVFSLTPYRHENQSVTIKPILLGMVLMAKGTVSQVLSINLIAELIDLFVGGLVEP